MSQLSLKKTLAKLLDYASLDHFYPVGSYYETSDTSFNPNTAWGGTWVKELAGQVHVSAGTGYTVNGALTNTSDGGKKDAIIPYHRHSVAKITNGVESSGGHTHDSHSSGYGYGYIGGTSGSSYGVWYGTNGHGKTTSNGAHQHNISAHNTDYAGTSGNVTNANMQPYIVVNRWHRTA